MDKIIKIGVLGAGRGRSMIQYASKAENAKLVAICDYSEFQIERVKKQLEDDSITYYTSFDEFLNHDMDAVVLANYATEHAPFAIKCLEKGLNVISEVLPCQTMKQAVELCEAVEKSGKIYAYAENYCYMPATYEMKKLYKSGAVGEFEYGEGEYMHNCESIWDMITFGEEDHWRNNMYATFYCTHSIGPLIHITGLRPVSVTGFEMPFNARMARMGAKAGNAAVEMITLENGALIKSLHGVGCSKDSIWYSVYGADGRMESAREDAKHGDFGRVYLNNPDNFSVKSYEPVGEFDDIAKEFGHGNSDFYTMYHAVEAIKGNPEADYIDVYEALDMFLPGLLGYRSILNGGVPVAIPNFRNKAEREAFRNDTTCTDPKVAGDMLIPSYSKGNPEIPQEIYEGHKKTWKPRASAQNKQLKLLVFPKDKTIPALPEGYSIRNYQGEEDIPHWIRVCNNGLVGYGADNSAFTDCMEGIDVFKDCFFICNEENFPVATITAVRKHPKTELGLVHMVSVADTERGKGLGRILCALAEKHFFDNGVEMATLTTDDHRIPACKSYLSAGWVPVNHDTDMVIRWTRVMERFGIKELQMYTEEGEKDVLLVNEKV